MIHLPSIFLCDLNPALVQAWEGTFDGIDGVHVINRDVRELGGWADAIVSPANSFGYMTGGIDAAYVDWLGPLVQTNAQQTIREFFHGELPVGQATIVATGDQRAPWCVVAPTMRVPEPVPAIHAYLAFRAALLAVVKWNKTPAGIENMIGTIICPGLGTTTGRVDPADAALLMRQAYICVRDYDPSSTLNRGAVAGYTTWP